MFVISVAAQLAGMHPQTLRQYDRLGLVSPDRTAGRGRRYSARDIVLLREVQRLSQDEGVNLAGIKRILELELQVEALQHKVSELMPSLEDCPAGRTAARAGCSPPARRARCRCPTAAAPSGPPHRPVAGGLASAGLSGAGPDPRTRCHEPILRR